MASSHTTRKRFEKQNPGENNNTWGGFLNNNSIDLIDESFGVVCVAMTTAGDSTLSQQNGLTDEGRRSQIILTGAPTSNVRLFVPAVQSFYLVRNKMTGVKKVTLSNVGGTNGVDFSGTGSGAEQGVVISDGTNVREVTRTVSIGGFSALTSTIIGVVSDATTDTTGGAGADFVPFFDISENGSLNKVRVSTFFTNIVSEVAEETAVAVSDAFLMLDLSSGLPKKVNVPNLFKGVNLLTAETVPDINNDYVPLYDDSASTTDKTLLRYIRGGGVVAKTASYTTSIGDSHSLVKFTGLSADATLTLPAATSCTGMELSILNLDRTYGVIVDPNAAELIDLETTRKTYLNSPISIVCDGSNWFTKVGKWRYRSTELSYTNGTDYGIPHALGSKPSQVWAEIVCNTGSDGFIAGDTLSINPSVHGDSSQLGLQIAYTSTSVNYKIGTGGLLVIDDTNILQSITAANWRIRLYAEL